MVRRRRFPCGWLNRPSSVMAVALGKWSSPEAVPALAVALNDAEPLVPWDAAWALGRIGTEAARQALSGCADAWVREEIGAALGDR